MQKEEEKWRAIAIRIVNTVGKIANEYLDRYCELVEKKSNEYNEEKDAIANRWLALNEATREIADICTQQNIENEVKDKKNSYNNMWLSLKEGIIRQINERGLPGIETDPYFCALCDTLATMNAIERHNK